MSFHTHLFRKFIPKHKVVGSVQESIVFNGVPQGKLVCMEDIVRNVLADKNNDGLIKNGREVENVVKGLLENDFLGEAYGLKLEKFIKTL
jgi:hypothetical protein